MSTRAFARVLGIVLLVAGVAGSVLGPTHHGTAPEIAPGDAGTMGDAAMATYGYLLGLFPVDWLHNIFHIGWGIFGIAVYRSFAGARTFAKVTAVVYAVLTVAGLIPGLSTVFGILPLYGHDVWLHALITIFAVYFGFAARSEEPVIADRTGQPIAGRRS